ncbi:MAG: LamG-like jellyroll fold domain-containing protein, partial [Planctomycetota bacterium]
TIEVWIKRSSGISSAEVAVGRDDPATQLHWWTGLWGGGEAAFVLIEKDGTGSNVSDFLTGIDVIADGNWHLIVVVRDGATNETRLYVDFDNVIKTAPDDSVTIDYDSGFDSATEDLNIGHLVPGGFNFDGTLDEVAIYNRVLSEAEIAQHYNSGAGVSYCDPLARHELTVNPAPVNGTVNPPGGVYFEGRELEVTPVPDATFAFDGWSGDLTGFSNPASLVMDAAKTISAAFRADGDNDGASDAAEDAGPNGGDADSSGTLDSAEAYIASFNTADGQDLVTLEVDPALTLTNVRAVTPPSDSGRPADIEFNHGFFAFQINGLAPGTATQAKLFLPAGADPSTYWRFGPEPAPGDTNDHWYEFLFDGQTGADVSGDPVLLDFVDGIRGDDDLDNTNGTIVDAGGPGSPPPAAQSGGGGGGGGCFIATAANGS